MTAGPIDPAQVRCTPTRTLLRLYAATLTELLRRRVIRTRNAHLPKISRRNWLPARTKVSWRPRRRRAGTSALLTGACSR
jgi:hypothetical protein